VLASFATQLLIQSFSNYCLFCSSSVNNLFKHSQADIKVAPPTVEGRDEPYTRQFTQCEEKAEYIHFTPDFVLGRKQDEYGDSGGEFG
jgi:hypothetical protein